MNICALCSFAFFALRFFLHTYPENNMLETNVAKIETFKVFNECSDEFTRLDSALIGNKLAIALDANRTILLWLKLCFALFFMDIALLCTVPL